MRILNVEKCQIVILEVFGICTAAETLTVVAVCVVTDVPPLVDDVEAGVQTVLAVGRPLPPHEPVSPEEAVHAVVVQLLVLVQESVVHWQLLVSSVPATCPALKKKSVLADHKNTQNKPINK